MMEWIIMTLSHVRCIGCMYMSVYVVCMCVYVPVCICVCEVTFLWRPYLSNVSSTLPSLLLPSSRITPEFGTPSTSTSTSKHSWLPSPWTPTQPIRPHLIIISSLLHDLLYNYTHLQTNMEILQPTVNMIVQQAHTKPYM